MNHKELEALLSRKTDAPQRSSIAVVMSPDITRNAARLKKRREDRRQTILCILAALVFIGALAALGWVMKGAQNPQEIAQTAGMVVLGCMGMVLLCAPALAWCADEERRNEV